jgi:hypothetical protein
LRIGRLIACVIVASVFGLLPAVALEAVSVRVKTPAIDLMPASDRYQTDGDRLQVSTAPGSDGIVRRIEVRARETQGVTNWVVFALANTTDEQVDRLIVAPHYMMVRSGIFWPDLGNNRIVSITPSQGFRPERQAANDADVRDGTDIGLRSAALSLGAGSLQGQGQFLHAL